MVWLGMLIDMNMKIPVHNCEMASVGKLTVFWPRFAQALYSPYRVTPVPASAPNPWSERPPRTPGEMQT